MLALAGLAFLLWPTISSGGDRLIAHPLAGPALGLAVVAGLMYEPRRGFSGGNVIAALIGLVAVSMVSSVLDTTGQVSTAISSALVGQLALCAAAVGGLLVMVKGPKRSRGHKGKGHKGHKHH